jgi:chemosensory pili system protein ChpA (sensor histidine kinase/response regulator)
VNYAVIDLASLAWLLPELDNTFKAARTELAAALNEPAKVKHLTAAKQAVHQAVGALQVIDAQGVIQYVTSIEQALEHCIALKQIDAHAYTVIDEACFALLAYLNELQSNDRALQPVVLFAYYEALCLHNPSQALAHNYHPVHLYFPDLNHRLPRQLSAKDAAIDVERFNVQKVRNTYETLILKIFKSNANSKDIDNLILLMGLLAQHSQQAHAFSFWKSCQAAVQTLHHDGIGQDNSFKRWLGRINLQIQRLASGSGSLSERLFREALFYVASINSGATNAGLTELQQAVFSTYALEGSVPESLSHRRYGNAMPVHAVHLLDKLTTLKLAWDEAAPAPTEAEGLALTDGMLLRRVRVVQQLSHELNLQLSALQLPALTAVAQALSSAASAIVETGKPLHRSLGLEGAKAILWLEESIKQPWQTQAALQAQSQALVQRVNDTAKLDYPFPTGSDVSAHTTQQLLGEVMHEARVSLSSVEKQLDDFFRFNQDPQTLVGAIEPLTQTSSTLDLIGLPQASLAIRAIVQQVSGFMTQTQPAQQSAFAALAMQFSQVTELLDLFNRSPKRATEDFVFDSVSGQLKNQRVLVQPIDSDGFDSVESLTSQRRVDAQSLIKQVAAQPQDPSIRQALMDSVQALKDDAAITGDVALAQLTDINMGAVAVEPTSIGVESRDGIRTLASEAETKPVASTLAQLDAVLSAGVLPVQASAPLANTEDDLYAIFLEEAHLVLTDMGGLLQALEAQPNELTHLTDLRRGFHTLKGSARMVGFKAFGDAAWHVEHVVNGVLAKQSPASIDLIQFMRCGQQALATWLVQLDDALLNATAEPNAAVNASKLEVNSTVAAFITSLAPYLQAIERSQDRQVFEVTSVDIQPKASMTESVPEPTKPIISLVANNSGQRPQDFIEKAQSAVKKAQALEATQSVAPTVNMVLQPVQVAPLASAHIANPALDNMVSVGPLRLPKQLFAIYTQEAGQQIAELRALLAVWKTQDSLPSTYDAFKSAHSLKGSAATIGFAVLKELAAPLEQVLQLSLESKIALLAPDLNTIEAAVHALHLMLEKFAAAQYPSEQLLHIGALKALHAQLAQRGQPPKPPKPSHVSSAPADHPLHHTAQTLAAAVLPTTPLKQAAGSQKPSAADALNQQVMDVYGRTPAASEQALSQEDGAADEIDDDIWPDFVQEADAVLPKAQASLLRLHDDGQAVEDFKRDLHTLKGSSRMAGAMRMGALLHELESTLEKNQNKQTPFVSSEVHERLLSDFDDLSALYAALKSPDQNLDSTPKTKSADSATLSSPLDEAPFLSMMAQTSTLFDQALSQTKTEPGTLEAPAFESQKQKTFQPAQTPTQALSSLPTQAFISAQPGLNKPMNESALVLPALRMRTDVLDHLVNQASEMSSSKGRLDRHVLQLRASLVELTDNVERLRKQLREIEIQAESQMANRVELASSSDSPFDPLEFDRFTRFQELTRMLTESLNDMLAVRDTVAKTLLDTERDLASQSKSTKDLTQSLMRSRLVAFDAISDRLYRVVRQTARELGKQVSLDIQGGHLTLDRSILERITSGLEHLVRNSVVHGIETTQQRLASAKSAQGTISIVVKQQGNELDIVVGDDGAGLALQKIHDLAIAKGLLSKQALPTVQQLAELIFTPGFSTVDTMTELAGRGIGMDVVRNDIIGLGGRITLTTSPQHNTRFNIRIPLTLAINQVLMVVAQEVQYAIPTSLIQSVVSVKPSDLAQAYSQGQISQLAATYPFAHLCNLLDLPTTHTLQNRSASVILLSNGTDSIAMHVDSIVGNQEAVVKPLSSIMMRIPGLSSATLLNDGKLCLILDPVQLGTAKRLRTQPAMIDSAAQPSSKLEPKPSAYALGKQGAKANEVPLTMVQVVNTTGLGEKSENSLGSENADEQTPLRSTAKLAMVVDDSLTVRKVTQKLLLREGWQVLLAKDGIDALEQLQIVHPSVLLVDIEMPRMDGFDLTRNVRADPRLKATPIIIITSRIADKHRDYAFSLGVNAYMGKPYRDDELLAEMQRLTAAQR